MDIELNFYGQKKGDIIYMYMVGVIFCIIGFVFLFLVWKEVLCIYRTPFPLFCNGDKRFAEIVDKKEENYKTRSILKDIGYEKK